MTAPNRAERMSGSWRAVDGAVPGFSRVRALGGIEEYRLDANGLRVLHMENRDAPVALLMLTYAVGSRHETAGIKGGSNMIEHLMFKGSARFNRERGTSIFDLLHPLGGQANATTWLDRTNYFDLVPAARLDVAAEIAADRMRHLRISTDDLASERTVVLNEHDLYAGDPLEKLHHAVWRTAFRRHPYGDPVIGTRDDILRLTRERLFAHYHRYYRPDNATLTVIGGIGRDESLEIVRSRFAAVPAAGGLFEPECEAEPPQRGERRVTVEQAGEPGWAMLAYRVPDASSPDMDALELLGAILAGGKLARLYRPLIGAGLATNLWSCLSRLRHPGLLQIQAMVCDRADRERVERTIRDEIAAIRRDGVSGEEVARAQGWARGHLLTSRDGPVAIALQLNEAIAAGDWTAYATAADRLAAVRADDIHAVACRYLGDESLTVGHLVESAGAS